MAYAGAMRNGSTPRLVGMVSKVDEKTLCTESALNRLAPWVASRSPSASNGIGHDLNVQTDAAKATEFPKDVQVTRGWIVVKVAMTGRKSGLFQKSPRVSNGNLHWFVGARAIENAPQKVIHPPTD